MWRGPLKASAFTLLGELIDTNAHLDSRIAFVTLLCAMTEFPL